MLIKKPLLNEKQCGSCKQVLPIVEFWKNKGLKDGYSHWCKGCQKESSRRSYIKRKSRPITALAKVCKKCGIEKPAGEFSFQPNTSSGLNSYCKQCTSTYYRKRRNACTDKPSKVCGSCNEVKLFTAFNNNRTRRDGKAVACRACEKKARALRKATGDKLGDFNKLCEYCGITKHSTDYSVSPCSNDGVLHKCNACLVRLARRAGCSWTEIKIKSAHFTPEIEREERERELEKVRQGVIRDQ